MKRVATGALLVLLASGPGNAQSLADNLLLRTARLQVTGVSLADALATLGAASGVVLVYSPDLLPAGPVSCDCARATLAEALDHVLARTTLRYRLADDRVLIVPQAREDPAPVVSAARRVVSGVIRDSLTGVPLAGAVIRVPSGDNAARSDGDGRFVVRADSGRELTLGIRRIGYVPRYLRVSLSQPEGAVSMGDLALRPIATALDSVAVEADDVRRSPHLAEFYRRKRAGVSGTFITRGEIVASGAVTTADMVRRLGHVEVTCRHVPDGGCEVRRGRGVLTREPGTGGVGLPLRCAVQLWLDGRRTTLTIDEIPLSSVAAVEIYRGPSTAPSSLGQVACGVIGFWTGGDA